MRSVVTIMVDVNGERVTGRKHTNMVVDQGYTVSFRNYGRSCALLNYRKERDK